MATERASTAKSHNYCNSLLAELGLIKPLLSPGWSCCEPQDSRPHPSSPAGGAGWSRVGVRGSAKATRRGDRRSRLPGATEGASPPHGTCFELICLLDCA